MWPNYYNNSQQKFSISNYDYNNWSNIFLDSGYLFGGKINLSNSQFCTNNFFAFIIIGCSLLFTFNSQNNLIQGISENNSIFFSSKYLLSIKNLCYSTNNIKTTNFTNLMIPLDFHDLIDSTILKCNFNNNFGDNGGIKRY